MSAILTAFNYFATWCTFNMSELVNWKFAVVALAIYALHQIFKFKNVVKDVGDVGYEHLAETKKFTIWSKKIKPEAVAGARKNRIIGNVPPSYPNGWYILADSNEILTKQVKYVSALGENFAIFRGEDGVINIVDAICPHLGANIAIGGKVSGNCVECPFHGWKFDGASGECTSIPYSKTVPAEAKLKKWLSHETNKAIYVWYHAENEEPTWYPKTIPEIQNGTWRCGGRSEHYVNAHLQDAYENIMDKQHFPALHSSINLLQMEYHHFSWELDMEGETRHTLAARIEAVVKIFNHTFTRLSIKTENEGPSLQWVNAQNIFGSALIFINLIPVEPLVLKIVARGIYPFSSSLFGYFLFEMMNSTLEDDIIIWNHKKYEDKPLLTKEEETIKRFRRWFSQFYSKNSYRLQPNHFEW